MKTTVPNRVPVVNPIRKKIAALAPLDAYAHGWVSSHPALALALGSVNDATLLRKMLQWSQLPDAIERNGWFYSGRTQIYDETGLTRDNQETSRKRLGRRGILREELHGVPCRLWYKVDVDAVTRLLEAYVAQDIAKSKKPLPAWWNAPNFQVENVPTGVQECTQLDGCIPPNLSEETAPAFKDSDSCSSSSSNSHSASLSPAPGAGDEGGPGGEGGDDGDYDEREIDFTALKELEPDEEEPDEEDAGKDEADEAEEDEVEAPQDAPQDVPLEAPQDEVNEVDARINDMVASLCNMTGDGGRQDVLQALALEAIESQKTQIWNDVCVVVKSRLSSLDEPNCYFITTLTKRLNRPAPAHHLPASAPARPVPRQVKEDQEEVQKAVAASMTPQIAQAIVEMDRLNPLARGVVEHKARGLAILADRNTMSLPAHSAARQILELAHLPAALAEWQKTQEAKTEVLPPNDFRAARAKVRAERAKAEQKDASCH